ncbi:MAG: SLBB domain-containing protein [Fimbriimonadaceae bacterium]|nr:SLBB domain-containing protein [Fimbriimonadaceae bacterium]
MTARLAAPALAFVLAASSPTWAQKQTPVTPPPRPQPAPEQLEPEYRFQIDDVLRIQLLDRRQAEINTEVQVGRDGRITPPFLQPMIAVGRTVNQIRTDLERFYAAELRIENPKIAVVLVRMREMRASVVGAVRSPGSFTIRQGDTVLNLLSLGGDTLAETQANLRRATLTRARSREIIPIDLVSLREGDLTQNYELKDGDVLNVPVEAGLNRVLVWGKVRQPGAFPFIEGMTVMDALTQSGGEIPNQSRFSRVAVIREMPGAPGTYQRIECNIVDYIRKGDFRQNIPLQRRDVVFVPDNGNPNLDQINQVVSFLFILDRFGINILRF